MRRQRAAATIRKFLRAVVMLHGMLDENDSTPIDEEENRLSHSREFYVLTFEKLNTRGLR